MPADLKVPGVDPEWFVDDSAVAFRRFLNHEAATALSLMRGHVMSGNLLAAMMQEGIAQAYEKVAAFLKNGDRDG